ncbi:uncharacterized protein [Nicotiana sylvestris]|uniref:uncharacterized protein n=1 Tax=Nicotiana sylvestris TaxID=4096 RepID=UPI00388C5415
MKMTKEAENGYSMSNGDKSWMGLRRSTDDYICGVNVFLDKAFKRSSQGNEILCPCKKCFNRYWHYRNVVEDHLISYGFTYGYTKWVFHGEGFSSRDLPHPTNDDDGSDMHDDIDGLLHDTFRNVEGDLSHEEVREAPSEDAMRFFKLVEEGKQELYPGCESFSKLDFTIRLFLFKCIHGLSNVAFSDLLDLIKEAFPFAKLPKSFHKAKKCDKRFGWKNVHDGLTNRNTKVSAKVLRWSTKGRWACPTCNYDTCSQYLKHSSKMCYLGHRAFLPHDHPFRKYKKSFSGEEEHRAMPTPLSGVEVLEELREFNIIFGKGQKKRPRRNDDIPEKSKDHVNSRYDLQEVGIRKELQPLKDDKNRKVHLAKSCYSMKPEEKRLFCTVLKNAKLPKGCASNISHRVQVEEMKISGYKSHDGHFIMHYLLQVAVIKVLPKNVSLALIRLGNYFRTICSKVIRQSDLDKMQSEIIDIACDLETIFPPTFFDIMTHLPIHLVNEIKLGGPTHLRWMYPLERNLCKYKAFVRNRTHPKASIAEEFLAEECLNFCSRYLHDGVKTRFSRYQTEDDEVIQIEGDDSSPIFPNIGHPIGTHRYVLFNTGDEQVEAFIKEHKNFIDNHTKGNAWLKARIHSREFENWLREKVKNVEVPNHLRWLAKGPNTVAKRYTAYFINGYRFHTMERDAPCKTQNNGVTLSATTDSFASARDQNSIGGTVIYYGAIHDIIKINYWDCFSVVLFRYDWFHNEIDGYGLTRVYFNQKCSIDDTFVLASQVHQVFYVEDPIEKDVYYARNKVPVDLYDLEEENCPNIGETFWREPNDDIGSSNILLDVDARWSREDIPADIIDTPSQSQDTTMETSSILNCFNFTGFIPAIVTDGRFNFDFLKLTQI